MSFPDDTIAAIATPPGRGGVGIVRVSGRQAAAIMEAVLGRRLAPRVATVATFRSAQNEPLDAGIGLYFPAPRSYTGEDVLELHGHGGPAVVNLVLARCIESGARLAAPGEFTQRAFLNGKLDLAQAESVADLIDAATTAAAKAAARSLSGEFSREVHALLDDLIDLRMVTEAALDFPEEDIDFVHAANAAMRVDITQKRLQRILARAEQGALLREGLVAVLVGRPNVGKSSLMNLLARDDVAIVTALPGTTRDVLRRTIDLGGIPVTVVDTAGLRATDEPIEAIGIERTWNAVADASIALIVVEAAGAGVADGRDHAHAHSQSGGEGSTVLDPEDVAILARLPSRLALIVIHNKIDLGLAEPHLVLNTLDEARQRRADVWLSARTGAGVDLLQRAVLAIAGAHDAMENTFMARARHLEALRAASIHLATAGSYLSQTMPPLELFAEELRGAQATLGTITGEFSADDLLGVIFSRFCIGK